MIIHYEIEQGSEEWFDMRLGRLGSSEASVLLVEGKSESGLGTGAITLLVKKISESITGEFASSDYKSPDMEHGNEYEPFARSAYENIKFEKTTRVGYVSKSDHFGYSPDDFVGDDGLVEYKCLSGPEFVRYSLFGVIDKKHLAQMQWGLWMTKRKWCDYVVYHPDFLNRCVIKTVLPDPAKQATFDKMAHVFEEEVKKGILKMNKK